MKKGSVLIHVLVMGIIVAIIASGLMSVLMMQYRATSRTTESNKARAQAEELLAQIITTWSVNGSCTTIPPTVNFPQLTCAGGSGAAPSVCGCTCTATVNGVVVGVTNTTNVGTPNGTCQIKLSSNGIQ